jgi:hypothetical protein
VAFVIAAAIVPAGRLGSRARAQDEGEKPQEKPEEEPGGLRELAPSWRAGFAWSVLSHPLVFAMPKDPREDHGPKPDLSQTFAVRFHVNGVKTVDSQACHEVVVTSDHRADEEITLLVRTQDLSLKELRRRVKTTGAETVRKNGRVPFLWTETSSICPLDFPLFPRETKDEEKTFDVSGRKVVQKITLDKEKNATVELKTTLPGGLEIACTQVWKRGAVFWSKATHTRNGAVECDGELDEKSIVRPAADGNSPGTPEKPADK